MLNVERLLIAMSLLKSTDYTDEHGLRRRQTHVKRGKPRGTRQAPESE